MLSPDAEIPAEERDRILDRIADQVARRGLQVPAVLFLELHRPLQFLTSQALVVFGPLLTVMFPPAALQTAVVLLQDRENVERLVHRIEALA